MKFECGDLERALASPDLMPEAREHLKTCAACRKEYQLWTAISAGARELHEEWETPALWPQIRQRLEAERKPAAAVWWRNWTNWAAAAAIVVALLAGWVWARPQLNRSAGLAGPAAKVGATGDQDFLTEQALAEVEKSEAAYRGSIRKLARLAEPILANSRTDSAVNSREKLLLIDSAIADTRTNVAFNRFNVRLQITLADLYREKQQVLQEILAREKN